MQCTYPQDSIIGRILVHVSALPTACLPSSNSCALTCRTVNIHLINTLGVEDVASCIECRCPVELEMKNGGGVLCCTDCPSTSTRGIIEYAMDYTTIYRSAQVQLWVSHLHICQQQWSVEQHIGSCKALSACALGCKYAPPKHQARLC